MRSSTLARTGVVAALLVATLAGCSSSGKADEPTKSGTETSTSASVEPAPSGSASDKVTPAKKRTVTIDEKKVYNDKDAAYTLTVNKAVINDYYVEVEIRIVNDGAKTLSTWYGSDGSSAPRLFDDRGREFQFQPQAGGKDTTFRLDKGEGVDAVLVYAGAVGAEAKTLTFSWDSIGPIWNQVEFTFPAQGS